MGWTVPSGTRPEAVRFNGDPSSIEFWRDQTRAARLLNDIERALNGLQADGQDVEHFRDILPTLYQVVFSYTVVWQHTANGARAVIDLNVMRLLKALAGTLDLIDNSLPISGEDLKDLLTYLDDVEKLVRGSEEIDDAVRRYLLGLIVEAKRVAAEYETFGDVELRSVTFELGAALLNTADAQVPADRRGSWIDGAKQMIKTVGREIGTKALDRASDAAADGAADAIGSAFNSFGGA